MTPLLSVTITIWGLLVSQPNGATMVYGVFPTEEECTAALAQVQNGACTKFQSVQSPTKPPPPKATPPAKERHKE